MVQLKAMWEPEWVRFSKGKDPQKVADEIFSISNNPTKEQIVQMARDPTTESHDLFEWDDSVAAEKWRGEQAGLILRNLKVTFVNEERTDEGDSKPVPVRMFYGDPTKTEGFVSVVKIMSDQDLYQQLLQKAKMELQSFKKKYSILKELQPLFDEIDKI